MTHLQLRYNHKHLRNDGLFSLLLMLALIAGLWGTGFHLFMIILSIALGPILLLFWIDLFLKSRTEIDLSESELKISAPFCQKTLNWNELSDFKLKYYQPKKSCEGWMEVHLKDKHNSFKICSYLNNEDSFQKILERAAVEIQQKHISLDPHTEHNLAAFGLFRA